MKRKHWLIGIISVIVVAGLIYLLYRNSNNSRIKTQIKDVNARMTGNASPDELVQLRLQEKALLNQLG